VNGATHERAAACPADERDALATISAPALIDLALQRLICRMMLVRVHRRWHFSVPAVLLLGGLYKAGVDWLLGRVLIGGAAIGPALVLLVAIDFWQYVVAYSPIVLPSALLVSASPAIEGPPGSRWADAVMPLGWLLPYAMFLRAAASLLPAA
jgi:hypothetical protein